MADDEKQAAAADEERLANKQKEAAERNAQSAKEHNARMLAAIDNYTITGVRLANRDKANEGMVVNFTAEEAPAIMAAIKAALQAR